jgi:pimeloyl-ACP methyl ester carboxylesterase
MRQRIRFCRTADSVRIAYATHGEGQPLVKAAHWMTHLEHDWDSPVWAHWLTELGRRRTVVRYDARDTGLSDRGVVEVSLGAWVADLEAVVDDAGLDRFPLFAMCQAGPVGIAYAARHPDRVRCRRRARAGSRDGRLPEGHAGAGQQRPVVPSLRWSGGDSLPY